jgi:uncharacterized surface protein with fasciclin (FAS1) repeats
VTGFAETYGLRKRGENINIVHIFLCGHLPARPARKLGIIQMAMKNGGTDMKLKLSALALSTALVVPTLAAANDHGDIIDIASGNENFSTLVAAVSAAGLVETLQGEGPFTVFAPTDEAFAALPEGTVEALLEDIPTLTSILTYHVVPGEVMSGDLEDGMTAETVNGQSITIGVGDTVTVDGATVIDADIEASNGVIHVIDAVIMPE